MAAGILRDKVKEVSCSWAALHKLALTGSKLEAAVDPDKLRTTRIRDQGAGAHWKSPRPCQDGRRGCARGDGRTLGQRSPG